MIPIEKLLQLTSTLTAHLAGPDRYQRLLSVVQELLPCDAAVLLIYKDTQLIPVAWTGLVPEVGGMTFKPSDHPRLENILFYNHPQEHPLRFPLDSDLPDPWDGLMLSDPHACAKVHSCMGCPLKVEGEILGLISVDALDPHAFDDIDNEILSSFAHIASAAVHTSRLIDDLEWAHHKQGAVLKNINRTSGHAMEQLLGATPAMARLKNEIEMVASSDLTVLISGETGVGKELVATAIHALSSRVEQPLVHLNCAILTTNLIESQLFGHKKGAFTGANEDRLGIFEMADGGTVFLDEIGELPFNVQSKLLRTLQQGEIQRVGESLPRKVDVRVIAATNRDLDTEQKAGHFRSDLYYRLAVYPILVPPLKNRRDDIPLLAGKFLEREAKRLGCQSIRLNQDARQALLLEPWPGNVRELEHVLMRAAIRAKAAGKPSKNIVVDLEHLDMITQKLETRPKDDTLPMSYDHDGETLKDQQDRFTQQIVKESLLRHQTWSATARSLGLTPSNLQRLAKRLHLKSDKH